MPCCCTRLTMLSGIRSGPPLSHSGQEIAPRVTASTHQPQGSYLHPGVECSTQQASLRVLVLADGVPEAEMQGQVHAGRAQLVWLGDALDARALPGVEHLEAEAIRALGEPFSVPLQLVRGAPQVCHLSRRQHVLDHQIAVLAPELLL